MASVEITPDRIRQCLSLKLGPSLGYIVFKVSTEMTQIVADKHAAAAAAASYDDFAKTLPASDSRYVVNDFPYVNQDGARRSKIHFII